MPKYDEIRRRIAKADNCPEGNVVVKSGTISTDVNMEARMVYGWATRELKDQENEVVLADGLDLVSYFPSKVKSVYYNHDIESEPVGVARRCFRKGDGLYLATYIMPTAFGNDLLVMVNAGAVGHYSIGGIVKDASPPDGDEMRKYGMDTEMMLRSVLLREVSLVAMPCLPDAMLEGVTTEGEKRLGIIDGLLTKGLIKRSSAIMAGLYDAELKRHSIGIEFDSSDDSGITFG